MKSQPDLAEVAAARAAVREMIREAHEVLKDLRTAIREARELQAGATAHVAGVIMVGCADLNSQIEQAANDIMDHLQEQVIKIADYQAKLLGAGDSEAMMAVIIRSVTEALIEQQDRWLPGHLRVKRS